MSDQPLGALSGRRIVVGVSGSIAAYKAVLLVRRLLEGGAVVDVAMPTSATRFVPGATDQSSDPTEATVVTRAPEAFQTTMPSPGVAAEASTTSSWLAWMAGERGYAPATIALRLSTVKAFLAYCSHEDITLVAFGQAAKTLRAPASPRKPIEYLTTPETRAVLSAFDGATTKSRRNPVGARRSMSSTRSQPITAASGANPAMAGSNCPTPHPSSSTRRARLSGSISSRRTPYGSRSGAQISS